MDGNGRWAKKRGMPRSFGHAAGASVFKKIVEYCGDIGIKTVTVYAFSTENWKRPQEEIDAIIKLLRDYIGYAENTCHKRDISMRFLGSKDPFPPELVLRMNQLESSTANYSRRLNVALNYGGRDDIVHAVNRLIEKGRKYVTEDDISSELYTSGSPDPDLIVRTGCEKRLSNFMLWESAYSELIFSDILWPDVTEKTVDGFIYEYGRRKRRFGGIGEDE